MSVSRITDGFLYQVELDGPRQERNLRKYNVDNNTTKGAGDQFRANLILADDHIFGCAIFLSAPEGVSPESPTQIARKILNINRLIHGFISFSRFYTSYLKNNKLRYLCTFYIITNPTAPPSSEFSSCVLFPGCNCHPRNAYRFFRTFKHENLS